MEKIKYTIADDTLRHTTPCPHGKNCMVASAVCSNCEFLAGFDSGSKEIYCNHPEPEDK